MLFRFCFVVGLPACAKKCFQSVELVTIKKDFSSLKIWDSACLNGRKPGSLVYQLRDSCYVPACLCHARRGDLQEKCMTQGEDVAYLGVCRYGIEKQFAFLSMSVKVP